MKKLLVASLTLVSLNSFAQSYMVLNTGTTLTVDKAGFIYDFNHFFLPYKVNVNGGSFLVADEKLNTIDANGFLYNKTLKVEKVKGKGLNYFIDEDNHLITICDKGIFYEFDKYKSTFKKASGFGGNFFVVKAHEKKKMFQLFTINSKGNYFKMDVPGLNPMDIVTLGGNWFSLKSGTVYTVSKDGNVYPKSEVNVGAIARRGGNFMIDNTGKVFTVSDEGFLMLPVLPENLKLSDVTKLGANYMIDREGRVFAVDAQGNIYERTVTDHDIRNVKVLSF